MEQHQLNSTFALTKPLAVVDTEWTDTDPEDKRIVSIAVTRFETDGTHEKGYWLLNPERHISRQATAVHGITDEDADNQPTFKQVAPQIKEILKDADIAGYSVKNDIEIIEKEFQRAGEKWTATGRKVIDALRLWQVREPRTLSDAYRHFVGDISEETRAHDARSDVAMTTAVINAMQQGKSVAELHQEAHPNMVDPAGKFLTENGEIIYNMGPYRGTPVQENPEYLGWMLTKSFAPSTLETARKLFRKYCPSEF